MSRRGRLEAVDWEMAEERERFSRLSKDESKAVAVSAFNLFQTPEPIAELMVQTLAKTGRTLEPSAGLGRLYRAVRAVDQQSHITLVDESTECCGQLYKQTEADHMSRLVTADFLATTIDTPGTTALGTFDAIVMNPPFKMWRDIKHILHARTFLRPGGRLVALCANGPKQQSALRPIASSWVVLPDGSFGTEGTHVSVAMLTLDPVAL